MIIFSSAQDISKHLEKIESPIAFIPTMGALHEGHISLLKQAKKITNYTVCSIFVNPTQFNNSEDLTNYPRQPEDDIKLLIDEGCDVLFMPSVNDIYPDGDLISKKTYHLSPVDNILEGQYRPGHFNGVAQVVDRLLDIVKPEYIILGQKDLQQIAIISLMIKEFHPNTKVVIAPTLREKNGLAKSSRNARLNQDQLSIAPIIYQNLNEVKKKMHVSTFGDIKKSVIETIHSSGMEVEYLELIDRDKWIILNNFEPNTEMAVMIAVYNGPVRLIDNILL